MPKEQVRQVRAAAGATLNGSFVPDTFNEQARTIDVCFGTDEPILMGYYDKYFEILGFGDGEVRMGRLNAGAPMLDSHKKYEGTANQPGVIEKAWVKDGKGYATLRFTNDAGKAGQPDGDGQKIMERVRDGIVRCVSVGYNVFAYTEVESAGSTTIGAARDNSIPTLRAVDWEPYEISFVSIPADTGAGVRHFGDNKPNEVLIFLTPQNEQMKRHLDTGSASDGAPGGAPPVPSGNERGQATPPAATTPPAGATPPAAAIPPAGNERGAQQEPTQPAYGPNERGLEIMDLCSIAGLPLEFARTLSTQVVNGQPLNSAGVRQAVRVEQERISNLQASHGQNRGAVTNDESDNRRNGMTDALLSRVAPDLFKPNDNSQRFRSYNLLDMARETLEVQSPGMTRNMTRREIAECALGVTRAAGMMSTSDFPITLGNTINRTLRAAYESRVSEWRTFARRSDAKDFRDKTSVQLSEMGNLDLINEGGEYSADYLNESAEKWRIYKYGKTIGVTWETIVNDDLNFLGRLPQMIAETCTRKQDDIVYSILTGNPVMADGFNLFSTQHANLLTAAAINVDSLGVARLAMRQQKGPRGNQYLNLYPKYLVVGPTLEQVAMQFMAAQAILSPQTPGQINVWANSLKIIVEPRITDNRWFLIADPASVDTIEYGFLEGEAEIFTSMKEGWEVDGMQEKVRMCFGAKAIDYRGFVMNPGV